MTTATERHEEQQRQLAEQGQQPLSCSEMEHRAARERAIDILRNEAALRHLNAQRLAKTRTPYKGQHMLAAAIQRDAECCELVAKELEGGLSCEK